MDWNTGISLRIKAGGTTVNDIEVVSTSGLLGRIRAGCVVGLCTTVDRTFGVRERERRQ